MFGWSASARWSRLVLVALMLAATFPIAANAEDHHMGRTITVSASGTATAMPDSARIETGVVSEAATARDAVSANNAAMAKLIVGLKGNGIEPKDIQTTNFNLSPRYTNPADGNPPLIDGYQAFNQVEIHVRNLDKIGEVLDKFVTIGANQVNGISFEVSNVQTLSDAARKDAVANAPPPHRAELYTAAADAKIGKVMAINEGGSNGPRRYFKSVRGAAMAE
ncbi:MAG: hypothetical protein B7Y80_12990 [Hyphomicrobium sp. 32-62-53]|nr:MAG: hypothetical protein B7Z29_13235 [Hyphomicrobium sp. 12-62-95]OYX98951.1 MAG: hypothetical protein B7Y80_12990 [Hyphomicrobium sp. 32-62-53]